MLNKFHTRSQAKKTLKIVSDKVSEILKNMNEGSITECDKLHRDVNSIINGIYHENKTFVQNAV